MDNVIPNLQGKKKSVFSTNCIEFNAESRGCLQKLGTKKPSLRAVVWAIKRVRFTTHWEFTATHLYLELRGPGYGTVLWVLVFTA